ncbi:hypothetical protein GCM10010174_30500 [Kutzneria viridogrisea]|uniref:Uncharacterized protein n=1 Tax=Kutzneria albida DSM 43870 TaxID=1449976 RepID=W5VYG1_9PSEU|nr:hypothetical protein KALB_230 [Kutzneria albida DSM 43870]
MFAVLLCGALVWAGPTPCPHSGGTASGARVLAVAQLAVATPGCAPRAERAEFRVDPPAPAAQVASLVRHEVRRQPELPPPPVRPPVHVAQPALISVLRI